MSLNTEDLGQIRTIVREEVNLIIRDELESSISSRIDPRFDTLEGRLQASEYDINEIISLANDAGIELPRN
jgi:hypothetical protein